MYSRKLAANYQWKCSINYPLSIYNQPATSNHFCAEFLAPETCLALFIVQTIPYRNSNHEYPRPSLSMLHAENLDKTFKQTHST